MEKLEKIIKYLDGEVIGEEKQLLEKEIAADQELKNAVSLIKDIDSVIADSELMQFANTIRQISENENKPRILQFTTKSFTIAKIIAAASVVILISITAIWFFTSKPTNDKLYSQFYSRYDNCFVTRGDSGADALITAIQLYDNKKYPEAISKFNEIIISDNTNIAAHFFLGITYMETKAYNKALDNLNAVILQKNNAFLEHAEWYMALCYLKINRTEEAKTLLKNIATGKTYYSYKAVELLNKL